MLPPGFSEAEFLVTVEHIVTVLCSKFASFTSSTYYDKNDLAQLIRLNAWVAVPRFRPEAGSLDGFLFRHCKNRILNTLRAFQGRISEPPCQICHEAHLGRGPGHEGGQNCKPYLAWLNRNKTKAFLARPLDLGNIDDKNEPQTSDGSVVENDAETTEILRLLDSRLDVDDRRALLMMREGVQVPKRIRREVEKAVIAILEEAGLSTDDVGIRDDYCEDEPGDDIDLTRQSDEHALLLNDPADE